jgi:hypothetical protein
MASVLYNSAKANIMNGTIDLNTHDIRARLVMLNTTCDTENDGKLDLADFTTIDPSDATGYADVALASEAVTINDANDRAYFSATGDLVFSGLSGNASRNYVGVLLYKYVDGTNANDLPLAYIEFTAPVVKEATQVTVTQPAAPAGWLYLT